MANYRVYLTHLPFLLYLHARYPINNGYLGPFIESITFSSIGIVSAIVRSL